ncbi:MAG: VWA domain-containing protein, partial [Pseudomonadota bacterium]
MSAADDSWTRAAHCLHLLRAAPGYLPGATIRMRAGPQRDRVLHCLAPLDMRRIHPTISDEQLFGGLDLAATLKSGKVVDSKGIFFEPSKIILTMAERCGPGLAAKLAHQLDRDAGHCIVALDEGAEPDEKLPPALSEQLPFYIAPDGKMPPEWDPVPAGTSTVDPAAVASPPEHLELLTEIAARFGIDSLRAPLLALRVARTQAACEGRAETSMADVETAAQLVYPHRATQIPEPQDATEPAPQEPEKTEGEGADQTLDLPQGDMVVEAVRALLPPDLLSGLVPAGTARRAAGDGAGQGRKGNRRGRPLPSRPGKLDGRNRIDLVATLRAAAPWQPLRRHARPSDTGLQIRPSDIRVRRFLEHSDRLLIFAVDASGSAAVARLNEAKGAIESLLAQAYAARDHVALVSFRGSEAELLLPPTRSLVQTKRRLASLPGGGGTPLATGLRQAFELATQARSKGLTPTLVLLTDGRANIALDG